MAKELSISSTPSLTPPLTEEEQLDWLRLLRSRRVGISTFFRLMAEQESAAAALAELPKVARDAGLNDYRPHAREDAEQEIQAGGRAGATAVFYGNDSYPSMLSTIPDPPPILWCVGDLSLFEQPSIALVGARNASSLGLRMARHLAGELVEEGFVLTSGLARGIDTAVHQVALNNGTIAVMAGGVDVVYPPENAVLAQEIGETGLIVSEQPMHLAPQARHFPRRNRLISGLSRALVVVEAAAKSGSLITARAALDQGREVLAVPGHPFDARASGCNLLIRDGAQMVRGGRDVIDALASNRDISSSPDTDEPAAPPKPDKSSLAETSALHRQILDRLGPSPVAEDQLIRDLGCQASDVAPVLVTLELDGEIERQPGGLLSRSQ